MTGGGPDGPGGARNVRNQRATAASSREIVASSINRLWASGRRMAPTAKAKTTAKKKMSLSGTIAKAIPSSLSPSDAAVFMVFMAAKAPKMVIAVARDIPAIPIARCLAILPDAASQVWKEKNKTQEKKTIP